MRILFFGDSIAQGFYDNNGGWVHTIRAQFDAAKINGEADDPPTVFNQSISGDTATGVLKRFKHEATARIWPNEEMVIVFAIGINDSVIDTNKDPCSPDDFQKVVTELIAQAKTYASSIMIVGLTPVLESITTPLPWAPAISCTDARVEEFDAVLQQASKDSDVMYVDLYNSLSNVEDLRELMYDGVHPNKRGHDMIAKLVLPRLQELIER